MENSAEIIEVGSSGGFFSLFDSTLGIIVFILLVLIVLLVAYVIFKRLTHKMATHHEKRSLKEDLMIWSNLSNLVSGGKKTKEGKEELSGNIRILKFIFDNAINHIKKNLFNKNAAPWFVMVGEPLSGKSTLLGSDNLNLTNIRKELDTRDEEGVHFFVSRKTVFLDVKGKVFFDNWLGGSSAEWQAITTLIGKYHRRKPLSGIILTIPADALIVDDKDMCLKKANIIASELTTLTKTLRMELPCRIVITKADCIVGFREYFSSVSTKLSSQAIGFDLNNKEKCFDKNIFDSAFGDFVNRIRSGAYGLMASKEILDHNTGSGSRMDLTTYIYSFPSHLDELKDNLEIYLSNIFDKKFTDKPADIEGVYFCSANDLGINFSADFAKITGQKIDEAMMVSSNTPLSRPYFIQNILGSLLTKLDKSATFTKSERMRRSIPKTVLCSILSVLSFGYLFGAIAGDRLIYQNLSPEIGYYSALSTMFDKNAIQRSPLFGRDPITGEGVDLFDELVVNDAKMSRFSFYNESKAMLLSRKTLPILYYPSNYLFFDWNNLSASERRSIYNQILVDMVFVPATSNFAIHLLNDDSLFTEAKADALMAYMYLAVAQHNKSPSEKIESCLSSVLKYEYPKLNSELRERLTDIKDDGDDSYSYAATTQILLDPNYTPSVEKGIKQFINQMLEVKAYPESDYQQFKSVFANGEKLIEGFSQLLRDKYLLNSKFDREKFKEKYAKSREVLVNLKNVNKELKNYKHPFLVRFATVNDSKLKKDKDDISDSGNMLRRGMLEKAYQEYRKIIQSDFDNFSVYAKSGANSNSKITWDDFVVSSLEQFKNQADINITKDYAKLKNVLDLVNSTYIFDFYKHEDNQGYLNFEIMGNLVDILYISDEELKTSLDHPSNFEKQFKLIEFVFNGRRKVLDLFIGGNNYNAEAYAKLSVAGHKFLDFAEFETKLELFDSLLALYPNEKSKSKNLAILMSMIDEHCQNYNYDEHFSYTLAQEALGNFDVDPDFSPNAYNGYVEPILFLSSYLPKKSENAKGDENSLVRSMFSDYLATSDTFKKVLDYVLTYADSYVGYWGSFADSIKLTARDYETFHEFAQNSKAYQINSQLIDMYNFAHDMLSFKYTDELRVKTKNAKEYALKNIETRRRSISINFTSTCNSVLNSWALLPDDAIKANFYIKTLSKKQVRNDFTIVKAGKDSKYDIPWWSNFVNLGTALLKSEANYQTASSLDEFQSKLYFFPILKDAQEGSMCIETTDMKILLKKLRSYGLNSKKGEKKEDADGVLSDDEKFSKDEGADSMQEALLTDVTAGRTELKVWVDNVSSILQALSDRQNKLVAKISIPNLDIQKELLKEFGLQKEFAPLRYRYVEVKYKGADKQRYSTVVENEEKVIFDNLANKEDIVLSFYRYSDDEAPECTVEFKGKYSPLRMYLQQDGIYSKKAKASFVPVEVIGSKGEICVIFLKVAFDRELVSPEDWPSSENWPLISQF